MALTSTGPVASPPPPPASACSTGELNWRTELGGIRWQNTDDQAIPDQALRRTAKECRGHVERQPQEESPEDHPAGTNLDDVVVVVGAEETKQVEPADGGQHNPGRQDHLGIEPGVLRGDVAELGGIEKLERRADLDQAADHLDRVHPVAAAGHLRQQARTESQQEEGQRQHRGERGQAKDRVEKVPTRRHDQQAADHGKRAGERGDRERQGHEDHTDQPAAAFAPSRGVEQEAGQTDLEQPEKAQAECDEEHGDTEIQPGVIGQVLQERGREKEREEDADGREQADNRQAIGNCQSRGLTLALATGAVLPLLDKEVDGDRNHRPDAGHQQCEQPAQGRGDQERNQAFLGPLRDLAHRRG